MSEGKYIRDKQIETNDNVVSFDTLVKASVVGLASFSLYKSGALKNVVKNTAISISKNGDKLYTANHIRGWLNSHTINEQSSSLLRGKIFSFKHSFEDIESLKKVYDDTLLDAKVISQIIKGKHEDATSLLKNLSEINDSSKIDILEDLAAGNSAIDKITEKNENAKQSMRTLIYNTMMKNHIKSDDDLIESLNTNGYRDLLLKDIFDIQVDKDSNEISLKTKGLLKEFESNIEGEKNLQVNFLERMLNSYAVDSKGVNIIKNGNKAKMHNLHDINNLKLDKNLKITENGEIIDLRNFNVNKVNAVRGLATEFKIPVLGINPLKMLGFDKFGKKNLKFGYIDGDNVAPALTLVRGNSSEHTINKLKDKVDNLKDVENGVMVVDGDVYKIKGNGIEKLNYEFKKELHISYTNKGKHGFGDITQWEHSQLKMMGVSNVKSATFNEDNSTTNKILDILDIGKQDKTSKYDNESILNYIDPDNYIGSAVSKFINKTSKRNVEYYDTAHEMISKDGSDGRFGTIFVTNKAITLKDVLKNSDDQEYVWRFARQFFADFKKDPEAVTSITAVPHFMTDRLSTTIGNLGLGLSEDNNTGTIKRAQDIVLRRFAPIFGLYAGWQALNMIGESEAEDGSRINLNRGIMEMYASIDVGFAKVRDALGITNLAKNITELLPGVDQISELPGINTLNLNETSEERKEYWEHGKDAVRKGRYWSLSSSSSFTGGKIEYFRLNPLQRAKSDARFSDSLFGSRMEYLMNIANPYHYDSKHYYDRPYLQTAPAFENVPVFGELLSGTIGKIVKPQVKMHREYWYGDTPLVSSQIEQFKVNEIVEQNREFSSAVSDVLHDTANDAVKQVYNNNIVTDFFNNILAKVNAMIRKSGNVSYKYSFVNDNEEEKEEEFRSQYFDETLHIKQDQEHLLRELYKTSNAQSILSSFNEYQNSINALIDKISENNVINKSLNNKLMDVYYSSKFAYKPYQPYVDSQYDYNNKVSSSYEKFGVQSGQKKDFNRYTTIDQRLDLSNQNFIYRTGSGKLSIINSGTEKDPLLSVNVNKESPNSFIGSKTINYNDNSLIKDSYLKNLKESELIKANGIEHTARAFTTDFMNVAGIYGYGANITFIGDPMKNQTIVETASYSRSLNKAFWDQSLGGLGGDLSEIFRRFVQERKTFNTTYFNPIRNTMPEFLPGENGFIDFKHGDPFSKIKNGEERLPGEGYERAHGINVDDYSITSSKIGGDVNSIIKYYLRRDGITDDNAKKIVKKGTRMHESIENYMLKNHIAIDSEQKVYDNENDISGIYDVRIYDETAKSGEAIVDIKTISNEGFKEVVETTLPKEEHVKQVNFYLHNTNKDNNGGVLYVNRDDPTQMYMTKFKYSEKLYNETIDNVNSARLQVQGAIASGQISRAERYKPIDKYRILADVAPYSDELNDMKKYISKLDLSEKDKAEYDRINDRLSLQRKQLRTYDYRFKTADVKTMHAIVDNNMGDNIFSLKGKENPIKFAGIKIKTASDFEHLSSKEQEEKIKEINDFINKKMKGHVKIKVAEDEYHRYNKDTYKTMDAIVYVNGKNLNRELIKKGYAEEDKSDYSATGVNVRFSPFEIAVGSAWESIAHQNTIFNNRILRVRSAKEEYERQFTYGVDFKSWTNPIENFIKPLIWQGGREESSDSRAVAALALGAISAFKFRKMKSIKASDIPIKQLQNLPIKDMNINMSVVAGTVGAIAGGTVGSSIIMGGVIGSMFGGVGPKATFGRLIGASVGAASVIGAKSYRAKYENDNNTTWVPEQKRKESETIDYLDKLKYVRNRRLFEIYAKKALEEDGINVKQIISDSKSGGNKRKGFSRKLSNIKRQQAKEGYFNIHEYIDAGLKIDKSDLKGIKKFIKKDNVENDSSDKKHKTKTQKKSEVMDRIVSVINNSDRGNITKENIDYIINGTDDDKKRRKQAVQQSKKERKNKEEEINSAYKRKRKYLTKKVNDAINAKNTSKELTTTSYNAMKAIHYYNESEKTMYAYNPGDSITDFIASLPSRDKKFFNEFLKAGEKEREEILKITPKYMTRALQSAYGKPVYKKENLTQYFSEHYLPGESWEGWDENYDFSTIETKVLNKANINLQEYGKWNDDIERANAYGPANLPNVNYKTKNINEVKQKLSQLLGSVGYHDIEIDVMTTNKKSNINLNFVESRSERLKQHLYERINNNE